METAYIVLTASIACTAIAAVYAMWRKVINTQRTCMRSMQAAEDRLNTMDVRLGLLKAEVTRQGIELEGQGIQLETQSYWKD